MKSLLALFFCLAAALAMAAEPPKDQSQQQAITLFKIKGSVKGNSQIPLTRTTRAQLRVVLNGGAYQAPVRDDGSFEVNNVSPGTYLVEIVTPTLVFQAQRVEIAGKKVKVTLASDARTSLPYPLQFSPAAEHVFFEVKEGLSMNIIWQNWYVLLMLGSVLFMAVMPKLLNVDPEQLREMQEQMAKDQNAAKGLLGGLLPGASAANDDDDD
jgi:hypothetical protein